MAEQQGQEKTEDATPKRLRDARKKGQVAKSKDLNTVVILISGFVIIAFMRSHIGEKLRSILLSNFDIVSKKEITNEMMLLAGQNTFMTYVQTIGPFLAIIVGIAFAVGFFQIGPIFTAEPMKPQVKRLNAVENLKNMFKITTLVELLKNIAKMSIIFWIAYTVVFAFLREIVLTTSADPQHSMQVAIKLITIFLIKVFIVFIVIAIIDLMVQRWNYKKQMRMTKDEVKREYKQDEGDPLMKGARKQFHRELAMSDVKQQVGVSDVVITNPTQVAVAVKYDDKDMMAPEVMAKGQRIFAQAIREIAQELGIPIVENPPLAWTLLEVDVGDEIPEELYTTVAETLAYVYKMRENT